MAFLSRCLVSILFLIGVAECRILSLSSSGDNLISDGIDGGESAAAANLSTCRHQYGFLPCGENAAGYIFLILVYQVLLVVGGKIIGSGSEVLFYITGERFGGILFRILRALPSMMLMICKLRLVLFFFCLFLQLKSKLNFRLVEFGNNFCFWM